MVIADRLKAIMAERGLSQSELARRVGVSQATIYALVSGGGYGSKHLHRIARELLTTPAYLEGEIDDPNADAPQPPAAPRLQSFMLPVTLPSEAALAEAFEALLLASEGMHGAELAQELARRLPLLLRVAGDAIAVPQSEHAAVAAEASQPPVVAQRKRRRA